MRVISIALLLFVSFCHMEESFAKSRPSHNKAIATVRTQVKSFNNHDVAAVGKLLAENIKWYSIDGEKVSIEGDGREAIKTWLADYFKSFPDVRSEVSGISQVGTLVSFRDRASWTKKDGTKLAQQSVAVYEVVDGLITRVWYFPAVRE